MSDVIPVLGMLTGIAIPLAVFFWQYLEGKERRATILEISKTIDDPDRLDELLSLLDEKKSEPTDSRRGGVITLFVGMGIYALGAFTLGSLFKGVGIILELDKENKIDTFTGMIGSGPAYLFYLLKSYEKKLMLLCGNDKEKVNDIMVNLIKGIGLSIEHNQDLDELIAAVASKKGTTEAGLNSFKLKKLNRSFEDGINAAVKRSKEISNEF